MGRGLFCCWLASDSWTPEKRATFCDGSFFIDCDGFVFWIVREHQRPHVFRLYKVRLLDRSQQLTQARGVSSEAGGMKHSTEAGLESALSLCRKIRRRGLLKWWPKLLTNSRRSQTAKRCV